MSATDEQETHYCGVQTYAGSYHVDPQPPEWCEEEVDEEGELCAAHEAAQRFDDEKDDRDYEAYREARHER